jgi:hypothetical protein
MGQNSLENIIKESVQLLLDVGAIMAVQESLRLHVTFLSSAMAVCPGCVLASLPKSKNHETWTVNRGLRYEYSGF